MHFFALYDIIILFRSILLENNNMKKQRNCLVLNQYRENDSYNNFIGKFYHFPGTNNKNYLKQFKDLPLEVLFYEPSKNGKGEFWGYGKIIEPPFADAREKDYYFVSIERFKKFSKPVFFKNTKGEILEQLYGNTHYDPQNSVRKIPERILDEICLDGGIVLNIESDVHLIKILGEQLIASEEVGVLELVKNSFDAGASKCRIRIEKIPDLPQAEENSEFPEYEGPVIVIDDNGCGMDKNVIENGWLRPASTLKTSIKEKLKAERLLAMKSGNLGNYDALVKKLKEEHNGRIPLGEKGVGRFATHRLGRFLELRTKTKDIDYELVLKIDWDKFDIINDDFINLNTIGLSLFREPISREYGESDSGTRLIIYGGREGYSWTKEKIKELNRTLLSINSPEHGNNNIISGTFNVLFECPQCSSLEKELLPKQSKANFIFDAWINEEGIIKKSILKFSHPNQKLPDQTWVDNDFDLRVYDENNKEYWKFFDTIRQPACGAFYMHMEVWYRTNEWIDLPNYKELTEYLDNFGGMSIYRDGLLVFDAKTGAETDWLDLNNNRIKKAGLLSYRDFIGNVEIDQTKNLALIDKTSREGMLKNQGFQDLSILIKNAIYQILLPRYLGKRDEYTKFTKGLIGDSKEIENVMKTSSIFFRNVNGSGYPMEEDPYQFFSNLWKTAEERKAGVINLEQSMKKLQESIAVLENTQQLFVEQAGFGISIAMSIHEINKIVTNFYTGVSQLLNSGNYDKLKLEVLKNTSESLRTELKRLSPLRAIRNEHDVLFEIRTSIKYTSEVFRRLLEKNKISFCINEIDDEQFSLFGKYSTINQVFGNLFDNSIYWLNMKSARERKIAISINPKQRTVIFADSGNGISDVIEPYLFQPGYSLRVPPSGLGLFICKTYLSAMKARIYTTPQKDRLDGYSGAQFTLDFSKTPNNNGI